ncbi:MAG: PEP/pyruvate-binding domain-containing protein [Bacteroidota bacterium]
MINPVSKTEEISKLKYDYRLRFCRLQFLVLLLIPASILLFSFKVISQEVYISCKHQYLSFGLIPTWSCVASDWDKNSPQIHLYDYIIYKGHGDFVSKGLKTGITFKQFKEQVRTFETRKYLPFFLFDLRKSEVMMDSVRYEWAVRIEDYSYYDTPEQMAETTLRLLNEIKKYISIRSGKESHGIIILAKNINSKPNISIAPEMNKSGFPNKTTGELVDIIGGEKTKILNPSTCVGYLKYIKAGEEKDYSGSFKDIVIFEKTPQRVPLVNGIITIEPQTPLSHVNLLAKNRSTFNMYTIDLNILPGIDTLIGKLVKIEYKNEKLLIFPVNENYAVGFWEKQKPQHLQIPAPDKSVKKIIDLSLDDENNQTVNIIGTKAENYSIIRKEYPNLVKKGFALPIYWYFRIIEESGAIDSVNFLLSNLNQLLPERRNELLHSIRNKIEDTYLPDSLLNQMTELLQTEYSETGVRFRSSTNCEDLPDFNGAGLYSSTGFNHGDSEEKLAKKILRIYASFWTFSAFEEREYFGIDHKNAGMAILINESFSDEYANGVAITIPEKSNFSILINSQFGENSVTNPKSGDIPEALFFKSFSDINYTTESRSNIGDVFLIEELHPILIQLKGVVIELNSIITGKLLAEIRQNYGIDIEFKIVKTPEGFKLFIKQVRLLNSGLPE